MTRYEQRRYFDRLVEMRGRYAAESHIATQMTIERAMKYAARLYADPRRLHSVASSTMAEGA